MAGRATDGLSLGSSMTVRSFTYPIKWSMLNNQMAFVGTVHAQRDASDLVFFDSPILFSSVP